MGIDKKDYEGTFTDVNTSDWSSGFIAAAYDAGIISGSDGKFRPNDTITREEICKIIASAINAQTNLKELDFTDAHSISGWAKESVQAAYSLGIINGMGDGTFAPKENALREQAFIMLARMIEKL